MRPRKNFFPATSVLSRASPSVSVAASTVLELANNIGNVRCWICSPEERDQHHLYGEATVERWQLPHLQKGPPFNNGALCTSHHLLKQSFVQRPGKAIGLSDIGCYYGVNGCLGQEQKVSNTMGLFTSSIAQLVTWLLQFTKFFASHFKDGEGLLSSPTSPL